MRWVLAGLAFALMVCLAVGTVAIRTENVRTRRRVETAWVTLLDRRIELDRVRAIAAEQSSPRALAQSLRRVLERLEKSRGAAADGSGSGALADAAESKVETVDQATIPAAGGSALGVAP